MNKRVGKTLESFNFLKLVVKPHVYSEEILILDIILTAANLNR